MPTGRCVELQVRERIKPEETDATIEWTPICQEVAPALFFVCEESRAEVLRQYTTLRGTLPHPQTLYYVDPKTDIFWFGYPYCRRLVWTLHWLLRTTTKDNRPRRFGFDVSRPPTWTGFSRTREHQRWLRFLEFVCQHLELDEIILLDHEETPSYPRIALQLSKQVSPKVMRRRNRAKKACQAMKKADPAWTAPRILARKVGYVDDDSPYPSSYQRVN